MSESIPENTYLCYDPRDPTQKERAPSTWKPTRNPALIAAGSPTHQGWLVGMTEETRREFWQRVADLANYCDEEVSIESTCPNPRAGQDT